jgi:1-acyl-sn-glycerol-3-phosphate acyltransferase
MTDPAQAHPPAMPSLPPTWPQVVFWGSVYVLTFGLFGALFGLRRWGSMHVPTRGPVLLLSNHQSYLDPVLVGLAMPQRGYYSLARSTLWKGRLSHYIMSWMRAIPVNRGASDTAAMRRSVEVLQRGYALLVFPEGTRTESGPVGEFKAGTMLLIRKARPVVVPVAIEGAHHAWPRTRKLPRLRGRIGVMFGPPIPADQLLQQDAATALGKLQQQVEQMRLELRARMDRA